MALRRSAYPCLKPQGQQLTKNGVKENNKYSPLRFRGYKHQQLVGKVSSLKCSLFRWTHRPSRVCRCVFAQPDWFFFFKLRSTASVFSSSWTYYDFSTNLFSPLENSKNFRMVLHFHDNIFWASTIWSLEIIGRHRRLAVFIALCKETKLERADF